MEKKYTKSYSSPLGEIVLESDGEVLIGLYFKDSPDLLKHLGESESAELAIFDETIKWLDIYFSGKEPDFTPKYRVEKASSFRSEVIEEIAKIPYGKTVTYGDITKTIKERHNTNLSPQAVGGAVGWNPICLVIPCHRVVGERGKLTGYGGGIERKEALLKLEGIDNFNVSKENAELLVGDKRRCKWCNLRNPKYIEYHDSEWGVLNLDENYLFMMLILESFQAGLTWECVLNKREDFKSAYDNFDVDKVADYSIEKVAELLQNEKIIRNKLKINASINNAKVFKKIQEEFGSFAEYLNGFTKGQVLYEVNEVRNELSDSISKDLTRRGMKFVGTTIVYSYLQAIGFIYSHDEDCFLYKNA